MDKVPEFLAGDAQVMLILGDSGSGKSTVSLNLEYELWEEYKSGDRIPLFIKLSSLDHPEKDLIGEQLKKHGFTDDQIQLMEEQFKFTLICDGYDESQLTINLHTATLLNRPGQWDTKLIVTCRTQYLGPDYRDRFVPKAAAQYSRPANDLFVEAVIAPFSRDQIEMYVEKYARLDSHTWTKSDFMDKLTTIRDLMGLVKSPFLLTLSLEALHSTVRGTTGLPKARISRAKLYDIIVERWLEVNKRRLEGQNLSESSRTALDGLLADGFERVGICYQEELAEATFREQDGRPVVDFSYMRDRHTWASRFFGINPDGVLLRDTSLLTRDGNQYRFIHRSVLESDSEASQAATSAMTILVKAGVRFHGADLRGIRIQGADLSGGDFDSAQLQRADLAGVNLTRSWIRQANFSRARMGGVQFGELPYLEEDDENWETGLPDLILEGHTDKVTSVAFSPSGAQIASTSADKTVRLLDARTGAVDFVLGGHTDEVTSISYMSDGHNIASSCKDRIIRTFDTFTGLSRLAIESGRGFQRSRCIAYSPDGQRIVSAQDIGAVKFWESATGKPGPVWESGERSIARVQYLP
ncbi:hypothetical protein BGX23_005129 [Mortierella sp. AD031]|nr:hypothetical protein BGX23_005129 [Mortierella sp. AD031]